MDAQYDVRVGHSTKGHKMKHYMTALAAFALAASAFAAPKTRTEKLRAILESGDRNYVFVTMHRGDWRAAPENSVGAILGSIDKGADIVELDVSKTKDGKYVLLHDGTLDRVSNGKGPSTDYTLEEIKKFRLKSSDGKKLTDYEILTLEEAFALTKGKILVNIDKFPRDPRGIAECARRCGVEREVILKGGFMPADLEKRMGDQWAGILDGTFLYMPIFNINSPKAVRGFEAWQACKRPPFAYELCFENEDSLEVLERLRPLQQKGGPRIWINTLWKQICGTRTDERGFGGDPDGSWGWCLENGATMIQTDRPVELLRYLASKGRRNMTARTVEDLRKATDRRIAAILATPDLVPPDGAEVRYVSEKGDDSADGKTPATAWRTPGRVGKQKLEPGTFVLFERGGTFRGNVRAHDGVTIAAYGKGPKPRIYASPENGADPAKWTRTDAPNVWRYHIGSLDVGTIVFNDGEAWAIKIVPVYNADGTYTQQYTKKPFNNGYKDLAEDLHFWHDYSAKTGFKACAKGTGDIYLYSERNPGERFKSIEFNIKQHCISVGASSGVHIDNLCIKYTGAHGVGAGTVSNLKVTNCEFGWIGGSIQGDALFGRNAPTRYGNAVEVYGGCDSYTVDNCYIYQVYDAGITQQRGLSENEAGKAIDQKHMRYTRNVIEKCNYSIEYFLSRLPEGNPSRMEDFLIEGNISWDAGYGFCEQRPDHRQAAHIKSWRNRCNRATGFVIRRNLFVRANEMIFEVSSGLQNPDGTDSMPVVESNIIYGTEGQDFGVLNQGAPVVLKYDSSIGAKLARFGLGNEVNYIAK